MSSVLAFEWSGGAVLGARGPECCPGPGPWGHGELAPAPCLLQDALTCISQAREKLLVRRHRAAHQCESAWRGPAASRGANGSCQACPASRGPHPMHELPGAAWGTRTDLPKPSQLGPVSRHMCFHCVVPWVRSPHSVPVGKPPILPGPQGLRFFLSRGMSPQRSCARPVPPPAGLWGLPGQALCSTTDVTGCRVPVLKPEEAVCSVLGKPAPVAPGSQVSRLHLCTPRVWRCCRRRSTMSTIAWL